MQLKKDANAKDVKKRNRTNAATYVVFYYQIQSADIVAWKTKYCNSRTTFY